MKTNINIDVEISFGGPNNEFCGEDWTGSGCSGYDGEYNNCNYFDNDLHWDDNCDGLLRCNECVEKTKGK